MAKVYITQESPGRNFLAAKKFGELIPVLPGNAQIVLSAAPIIRKLRSVLRNFNDDDFLLLSGDPSIMGVAVAIATEINNGRATLLKWDNREHDYYDVWIDLYDEGEADDD
tara:strand:- start:3259 stop:3591 length:333 start_codon:yes stop_codon:yes gene_type:complete